MLINKAQEAYTYNKQQQNNTILTQSYYDLVMKACDSIGTGFRTEFKNSTFPIDEKFVASRLWTDKKNKSQDKQWLNSLEQLDKT